MLCDCGKLRGFFPGPDGSGARVAAAALSGNREKLASCLRRHPMLSARPRPCVAGLPGSMEFWTVREYVHLAKLRAEDVGDEDRAEAFSEMLDSVDAAERQQAEALVRSFLNPRDDACGCAAVQGKSQRESFFRLPELPWWKADAAAEFDSAQRSARRVAAAAA